MRLNREYSILVCDIVMEYALYGLIFFLPISKAFIEIFASLAILAFIVKKIISKSFVVHTPLNKFIFVYLAVCILSIIFSTNVQISARAFFFKLLENVLIFFIVAETINSKKKMNIILIVLMFSAALICADGIFQFFTHIDFLRHRPWPYGAKPFTLHIKGPFASSNDFAAYLAPLAILSLSLFFHRFKKLSARIFSKFFPILLLICLFMSLSRGAWVGLFMGVFFLGFFVNKKSFLKFILSMLIAFILLWQFLPQDKWNEINRFNLAGPGGRDRRILSKISLEMFSGRPMFGLGLGTYMYNFERFNYDKKAYRWGASYAHNCYLQMAAETGLFGLFSFLLLLIILFYKSIKRLKKIELGFGRSLSVGLLAALFTYLIHSIFDTNLYNLDIGMLFWYLLGLSQANINYQIKINDKI
ncbi:MAG: O-antigen ligase family protein [Candidatus Omnitrophica bacterium]|nr:O-antigen ligase family protein [Candidatus Omnitrophota bacterium]